MSNEKYYNNRIGKISLIIGTSIIISLFVTSFLRSNINEYISLISSVERMTVFYLFFALILIVEGISFYRQPITDSNVNKFKYLFLVAQYGTLLGFCAVYFLDFDLVYNALINKFHFLVLFNIIPVLILLLETIKIIEGLIAIIISSAEDSKDRLTIVLTIFATIISAVALFK